MCTVAGEGHALDDDTVGRARQPAQAGSQLDSPHAQVEVPVHLSDRTAPVVVELQLRTVAMDFWAALEHKIYYKYDKHVPVDILRDLREAAVVSADLDARMESLHERVHGTLA